MSVTGDPSAAAEGFPHAQCDDHPGRSRRGVPSTADPDSEDTIARLRAHQEAAADVLFAPGLTSADDIGQVVESAQRPLNVVARGGWRQDRAAGLLDLLGLEALPPGGPPLGCFNPGGEVRDLVQDLAVAEPENIDRVPHAPIRVTDPRLAGVVVTRTGDLDDGKGGRRDPLVLAGGDPASLDLRRPRVVRVHGAVVLYPANALARLRHLPYVIGIQKLFDGSPVQGINGQPVRLDPLAVAIRCHRYAL